MSVSELDISWSMLQQVVRDWAGSDAELAEFRPLDGGSINTTVLLTLKDARRAVLKITPHRVDRSYEDETYQLSLLKQAGLPTPEIYAVFSGSLDQPFSYLIMEFVEGVDLHSARARCTPEQYDQLQRDLAQLTLKLHATRSDQFSRASKFRVSQFDSWHECYRDIFDGIWREVEKTNALPIKLRKVVNRVHDRLDSLLPHQGPPSLLHWDLWSTNLLARQGSDGNWHIAAVLDPNCKFGCNEAELAYMDLFHTTTPAFMKAYQQEHKLPPEYHQVRKPIYQMYSLINHVRLFRQDYVKALCAQTERCRRLFEQEAPARCGRLPHGLACCSRRG